MSALTIIAPVFGVLALLFAFYLVSKVKRQDEGTDRMREIAAFIHEGARAFLMAEYKILVFFVVILFVLIGLGISWLTAYSFLIGAVFSTAAGFIGMNVATRANVRTAAAAKDRGMNAALSVAFSGGAVMGMSVVGFGLVGAGMIYFVTGNPDILSGFSLGASSISLFATASAGISVPTLSVKSRQVFPRMTPVTPLLSPTTSVTTSVMSQAWVRTSLNPMWAPSCLPSLWVSSTMN